MYFLLLIILFQIITTQVSIISPPQLVSKINTNIKSSIGNFGEVPFGKTLMGYITIVKQVDGSNYWCDETLTQDIINEDNDLSSQYLPIVLVDHSLGCKYAEKAYNVQNRGGSVMLLVSDSNYLNDEYNIDDPIGNKIHIPTIIITKNIGDIIKEWIKENPDIKPIISIRFTGVKKSGEIHIEFFYRSDDIKALNFFIEFYYYKLILNPILRFTPRLKYNKFVNDKTDDSLSVDSKYPCIKPEHFCTSINNILNINNPREILIENLRQSCIYETYGLDVYWQYMMNFSPLCGSIDMANFSGKCSNELMKSLEIDYNLIQECMERLVINYGKVEEDYENFNKKKIFAIPELTINGIKYKGSWAAKNIFNTICNGFIDNDSICNINYSQSKLKKYFGFIIIIVVSLIIVIVLFCALYCYRKKIMETFEKALNERIQKQAIKAISEYQSLKEGKENTNETSRKLEIVSNN